MLARVIASLLLITISCVNGYVYFSDIIDVVPCNSTSPVCMQKPLVSRDLQSDIDNSRLAVVYFYCAGARNVVHGIATSTALAAMYGSQVDVFWCKLDASMRFLGKVLNFFHQTDFEKVLLESLPKFVVFSYGSFIAESFGDVNIHDLIKILHEFDSSIFSEMKLVSKSGDLFGNDLECHLGTNVFDFYIGRELERRLLYEIELNMTTSKNPDKEEWNEDDNSFIQQAQTLLTEADNVWLVRRAFGLLCCVILIIKFVSFIMDKIKGFAAARRMKVFLLDRAMCVPHVLVVESNGDLLVAARQNSEVLRNFLCESPMNQSDYEYIHALHEALLTAMTELEHDAQSFKDLDPSTISVPSERFLFYEQYITLGVLGFILDSLYRVTLPYRLLNDVLQRMVDIAVKTQRRYVLEVFNSLNEDGIDESSAKTMFANLLASRYHSERLQCIKQFLLGTLVRECWKSFQNADHANYSILLPEGLRGENDDDDDDGNSDDYNTSRAICAALNGPLSESGAIQLVNPALRHDYSERYLPGMWRTVYRSLLRQREYGEAIPGFSDIHSIHEQRIQQDPSEVHIYDFKTSDDPTNEMNAVVSHVLGDFAQPHDMHELQNSLEHDDFNLLYLFVFNKSRDESLPQEDKNE